ncbi:MAG TPA: hypothetical protein VFA26_18500 [Gemmataceae bacterium]|nr:hypothetical protein [Gemmataceae bacterium]
MATVTRPAPLPPAPPVPVVETAPPAAPAPAIPAEAAPASGAHPGDWFAMLLWAGCVGVMALMALLDFTRGLFR